MREITNTPEIVCFGEILWDIFPDGKRIGGAPFNVAYNLSKMGVDSHMISRIGNDPLGNELLEVTKDRKMNPAGLQIDDINATGTVIATFDEHNDAIYDIVNDVAWDHIALTENDLHFVKEAKAFVFGSLATRNKVAKNTLFSLMENAKFNVFDINLRPPFIDQKIIKDILHHTHLAKFNKAELRMVLEFIDKEYTTEAESIKYVQDYFELNEIIVSKGSKGAIYYKDDEHYQFPAVPITINDTVGSGDSFLAGFLTKRINQKDPFETMEHATALGAFITSSKGACPEYTLEDFELFKQKHPTDYTSVITNMKKLHDEYSK